MSMLATSKRFHQVGKSISPIGHQPFKNKSNMNVTSVQNLDKINSGRISPILSQNQSILKS